MVEVAVDKGQQSLAHPTALVLNPILLQIGIDDAHFVIAHQTGETCVASRIGLLLGAGKLRSLHFTAIFLDCNAKVYFFSNMW